MWEVVCLGVGLYVWVGDVVVEVGECGLLVSDLFGLLCWLGNGLCYV